MSICLIPFTWLMNVSSSLAGYVGLFIRRLVAKLLNCSSSKVNQVLNTSKIQGWGPDRVTDSWCPNWLEMSNRINTGSVRWDRVAYGVLKNKCWRKCRSDEQGHIPRIKHKEMIRGESKGDSSPYLIIWRGHLHR